MKIRKYPKGESSIQGTFLDLVDDQYIQVEVEKVKRGAVVLWSGTISLSETIAKIDEVIGMPKFEDKAEIRTLSGRELNISLLQANYMAQIDPDAIRSYARFLDGEDGSFMRTPERVKLKSGVKAYAELSYAAEEFDINMLIQLATATGSLAVGEAFNKNLNDIVSTLEGDVYLTD